MVKAQVENSQSSTKVPVTVFADFVCPWSYIAQEQVDQLLEDYDVELRWRPHWLHPEIPPEGLPVADSGDSKQRQEMQAWLKEMAPEMAARIRPQTKRHFSFLAFAAMEFAQDHGLAQPFRRAVYKALWEEGGDIGQISTLQECAHKVGLDAEELGKELRQRPYLERAGAAVEEAARKGIQHTPTVILGRTAILGWHYYEVFESALEKQGFLPKSGRARPKAKRPAVQSQNAPAHTHSHAHGQEHSH